MSNSQEWFDKDLSECILSRDPECQLNRTFLTEQQLTYFCGSAPECMQLGNEDALNKYNAERFYSVIGITERVDVTFMVLQSYLPRYKESGAHSSNVIRACL